MLRLLFLTVVILFSNSSFTQTPIGLKREFLISDLKKNNPFIQFEDHQSYFITNQLMYNDFESPRIQTGYYFNEAGICIKMIRMVPNKNLAAEIYYYKSLPADKKFKMNQFGMEYVWQEDAKTITSIDPKLSTAFSYAIVTMPFNKEFEKYRIVKLEKTPTKTNAEAGIKIPIKALIENNKWICIGMYYQENGAGDDFSVDSENIGIFNKTNSTFIISNPNTRYDGSYRFIDKESMLICDGYEDGMKKKARYKVFFKDSKLTLSQIQEGGESCYDYVFVKL